MPSSKEKRGGGTEFILSAAEGFEMTSGDPFETD